MVLVNYQTSGWKAQFLLAYFLPEVPKPEVDTDTAPPPKCPEVQASRGAYSSDAIRYLRYSGIMGSICKHHLVYKMVNISSAGEKYIFARKVLESFSKEEWAQKVLFKYDICCNFLPYLTNKSFEWMPEIAAIPVGHAMTHILMCQLSFFPWLVKGNGLSAGEEIETLWSKLCYLWARVREMGPGAREDEISDALEQINRAMLDLLPLTLKNQRDRIRQARYSSTKYLEELRKRFPDIDLQLTTLENLDTSILRKKLIKPWQVVYTRLCLESEQLDLAAEETAPETAEFRVLHIAKRLVDNKIRGIRETHKHTTFQRAEFVQYEEQAMLLWFSEVKTALREDLVILNYYRDTGKRYGDLY